ncbi:MAG: GYD domain-containing protein [Mesorhizobium sp.]|uniref:GYD domain-containing protein n=1 Tax=unclassified Mesorhizobium TaxID=325217 RepID=UPI000F759693|nr:MULTISPECIES: GYD domain-containing protein [unclassified Mesorhizobium]RVD71194.1 GYD domain-containing protein [Mesorhizobium sp. M4A.F.Ca.ET.029.04.2.1]AZO47928.1 GYD domain-containing protein [Mesorhizobium sp. M4B.F.Ca.ET.058.02.1.1]RUX47367.1 GYD domain-containing protein [Mesorhizobium sp. M4A.F.Ca.ET.050.02.1.1]RVC45025.1 GYD domain-containing protein [Mesorhizobium sp. M4A.F.Ca.ET.090.04.2.1]RVC73770.1 GYD domain-containing protein [Mesorhizobium sp. M4A.F.Ca.ET.022.05.2.1]
MSHYVILVNFTEQGAKSIKDTVKRAEAFKAMAADSGVKVNSLLWTLGQHDVVATVEANDDIAATALSLSVASLGNVRTQTLKAFDAADMAKILGKMAV